MTAGLQARVSGSQWAASPCALASIWCRLPSKVSRISARGNIRAPDVLQGRPQVARGQDAQRGLEVLAQLLGGLGRVCAELPLHAGGASHDGSLQPPHARGGPENSGSAS